MKTTHELIDREEPKCLYCGVRCDIKHSSLNMSGRIVDEEVIYCNSCHEFFEIGSTQHLDGETEYIDFSFTCNQYIVTFKYENGIFKIKNRTNNKLAVYCPVFEVDFSNKEKLWEKLRTYLIFS